MEPSNQPLAGGPNREATRAVRWVCRRGDSAGHRRPGRVAAPDAQTPERPVPLQRRPAVRHDPRPGQPGHRDAEPRPAGRSRVRLSSRPTAWARPAPAVCMPSRAMLHSGRSLWRAPIDLAGVPILPEVLRNAGYATFGTGKWHNGPASFARGFTDGGAIFFGGMSDHLAVPVQDFDPSGKYPQQRQRRGEKFSSELFADAAIDFLERHARRPAVLPVRRVHRPARPADGRPSRIASMYRPGRGCRCRRTSCPSTRSTTASCGSATRRWPRGRGRPRSSGATRPTTTR